MDIVIHPTQFEGETNGYKFRLNFNSNIKDDAAWALLRWKKNVPMIPPTGEILTKDGWQGILASKSDGVKYVRVDDIEQYLT